MKNVMAYGLVVGLSSAMLWHFSNIWRYGTHLVGESNILMRSLETAMLVMIFVFGIVKYIDCLKGKDQ